MKNKIYTATGIRLCELKERIYKTLGEYSANGVEIRDSEYEKSDMEKKILMCINTAVTKAVKHMPVYTLSTKLYFPKITYACKKQNVHMTKANTLLLDADTSSKTNALVIKCSGNFHVSDGENVLYEVQSCNHMEITKHAFLFDGTQHACLTLTAGEGGMYIDSLYIAGGEIFDTVDSSFHFPDMGMTFANISENIHEITYAEHEDNSIPVYKYTCDGNYVYTDIANAGKTSLHYTPKAHVFTEESAEDEMLLLPEITVCAVVYLAASELCSFSDSAAFNALTYKYRDIALNSYDRNKSYYRNSFYCAPEKKKIGKEV